MTERQWQTSPSNSCVLEIIVMLSHAVLMSLLKLSATNLPQNKLKTLEKEGLSIKMSLRFLGTLPIILLSPICLFGVAYPFHFVYKTKKIVLAFWILNWSSSFLSLICFTAKERFLSFKQNFRYFVTQGLLENVLIVFVCTAVSSQNLIWGYTICPYMWIIAWVKKNICQSLQSIGLCYLLCSIFEPSLLRICSFDPTAFV